MTTTRTRMSAIARWLPPVAAGALLSACNILGPAAYIAMGQPEVEAQYELLDRPTVVFVDDRMNAIPINSSRLRRAIADQVTMDLMEREILTQTISPRDAVALARNSDRRGELLSIQSIGEKLGAEQVIYVEMISFRGSPDGFTPRATGSCRVKVIDTVKHSRLFPAPDALAGYEEVQVVSPPFSPELFQSSQGRAEIERMLAALLGDRVGKLFYEWVPDEIGTRLQSR